MRPLTNDEKSPVFCTATDRGRSEDRWVHYASEGPTDEALADALAYELGEEDGGEWAMARHIETKEMGDDERRQEVIDQILYCNREDLEATWAVLRWLRAKVCQ